MTFKEFSFFLPGKIHFGVNSSAHMDGYLKEYSIKRVLFISDRGLEKAGLVQKMERVLRSAGIVFVTFLDVEANPSIETVEKGIDLFQENQLDGILCLGGGSVIDTAKAVSMVVSNGGRIQDYEGPHKVKAPVIPVIAVPTTAGTGSEVTPFTVITNRQNSFKFSIFSYETIPRAAILDPELITTLPPLVAASTGMDALTHAIESYISLASFSFSEAMSEKAMELYALYLRRFVANRMDIEAASGVLLGSMYAGVAFSWGRLGIVHAMAHPLGGFFDMPHGIANAVMLPTVLEYNALADRGKYKKILEILRQRPVGSFVSSLLVDEIRQLSKEVGIPENLSSQGVTGESIPRMAEDAMKSGNIFINPRQVTIEDIEILYRSAL